MSSSFRSPAASLRESFLAALLDSAVEYAIVATDLAGQILEWSRGAEAAFGWAMADAVGCRVDILFTPEDAAAGVPAAEMRAALKAGAPVTVEGWQRRRDGTPFWCDGKLTPLRDGAGTVMGFLRIARDRTERRKTEERLRRSERAFDAERGILRAVIRQAPVGISVAGATPEVPSMFSAEAERILGHRLGAVGDARYGDYGAATRSGVPTPRPSTRPCEPYGTARSSATRTCSTGTGTPARRACSGSTPSPCATRRAGSSPPCRCSRT